MKDIRKLTAVASIMICLVASLSSLTAEAGREGGNGGGTVVCRDDKHQIISVEVLDFYEARTLRGIKLDIDQIPGDWHQKVAAIIERIGAQSQFRFQLYSDWLKKFDNESKPLDGVEFSTVPDSGFIDVPKGCEFEQAAIQRRPIFTGDSRYYLNAELWNAMDDTQKAGLALHEIIYREAIGYGHDNSVRARYLTALYSSPKFATLSSDDYLKTLVQANFELTDIPAPVAFAGVETTVSTTRLVQPGPDQQFQESRMTLKNRFMVQLGSCDTNCANFDPYFVGSRYDWHFPKDGTSIDLPSPDSTQLFQFKGLQGSVFELLDHVSASGRAAGFWVQHQPSSSAFVSVDQQKLKPGFEEIRSASDVDMISIQMQPGEYWKWDTLISKSFWISPFVGDFRQSSVGMSEGSCAREWFDFQNDTLVEISSVSPHQAPSIPGCIDDLNDENLTAEFFKNGSGQVRLLPAGSSANQGSVSLKYDPFNPYVFADPDQSLLTWSGAAGISQLRCQEMNSPALDQEPCLSPQIESGSVASFTAVSKSPTVAWHGLDPSGKRISAKVMVGSRIALYSHSGEVQSFLNRDYFEVVQNGQTIKVPPGVTVHLDSAGNLVNFSSD